MTRTLRFTIMLGLVAIGLALLVPCAYATPPQRDHYVVGPADGADFAAGELCAFPVHLYFLVFEFKETLHFDNDGTLRMVHDQCVEQDAFSANGKTLIGELYRFTFSGYFDDEGNFTYGVGEGVLEKVRLPDGSWFIGAGRTDTFSGFTFFPNHGTQPNIDAFCAALAP
jgi:hypothetical protein